MMKMARVSLILLFSAVTVFAQIPSLIEVSAEFMNQYFSNDFANVLDYTAQGCDTIVLTTSGYIYTTTDTIPMVIENPVVIMAAEGLTEKPIFTHPNTGFGSGEPSSSMEIFRMCNDVEFHGVAFMGEIDETEGCKYGLRYGDWTDPATDREILGKTGAEFKFYDCDFIGFHTLKDPTTQGNVIVYNKPNDISTNHLRDTKLIFENCLFKDVGDECIKIASNLQYAMPNGVVACDSLVVKNCTFDNILAECVRVYSDADSSFGGVSYIDGSILIDHVTVVNSCARFIYARFFRASTVKNLLIANGVPPSTYRAERGDYLISLQLSGSTVANVDSFNCCFTVDKTSRIFASYGGDVDEESIYGYDPKFVDAANGDYTLASDSPLYWLSDDGTAIGDLNWATNTPSAAPVFVTIDGFGEVTSDPEPVNGVYDLNTDITLTAIPNDGYEFSGWSGDVTGSDNPITVTVDAAKNITATFTESGGNELIDETIPTEYKLSQNYPNPFNPTTNIHFDLKEAGWTTLSVYNLLGQQVSVLKNEHMNAGSYSVMFDASDLASGIYYYRLKSGNYNSLKKMVLIK